MVLWIETVHFRVGESLDGAGVEINDTSLEGKAESGRYPWPFFVDAIASEHKEVDFDAGSAQLQHEVFAPAETFITFCLCIGATSSLVLPPATLIVSPVNKANFSAMTRTGGPSMMPAFLCAVVKMPTTAHIVKGAPLKDEAKS